MTTIAVLTIVILTIVRKLHDKSRVGEGHRQSFCISFAENIRHWPLSNINWNIMESKLNGYVS